MAAERAPGRMVVAANDHAHGPEALREYFHFKLDAANVDAGAIVRTWVKFAEGTAAATAHPGTFPVILWGGHNGGTDVGGNPLGDDYGHGRYDAHHGVAADVANPGKIFERNQVLVEVPEPVGRWARPTPGELAQRREVRALASACPVRVRTGLAKEPWADYKRHPVEAVLTVDATVSGFRTCDGSNVQRWQKKNDEPMPELEVEPLIVCNLEAQHQRCCRGVGTVYPAEGEKFPTIGRTFRVPVRLSGSEFHKTIKDSQPQVRWIGLQPCTIADACLVGSLAENMADRLPVRLRAGTSTDWSTEHADARPSHTAVCRLVASAPAAAGAAASAHVSHSHGAGDGAATATVGRASATMGFVTRFASRTPHPWLRDGGTLDLGASDRGLHVIKPTTDGARAGAPAAQLTLDGLAEGHASLHWIAAQEDDFADGAAAMRPFDGVDVAVPAAPDDAVAHWPLTVDAITTEGKARDIVGRGDSDSYTMQGAVLDFHAISAVGADNGESVGAGAGSKRATEPSATGTGLTQLRDRAARACARSRIARFRANVHFVGPALPLFDGDPAFSIAAWVWWDVTTAASAQPAPLGTDTLFLVFRQGTFAVASVSVFVDLGGHLCAECGNLGAVSTDRALAPRRWYHIAVTRTPGSLEDNTRLYINGELGRQRNKWEPRPTGSATRPMELQPSSEACIGGVSNGGAASSRTSPSHPWAGFIEDASVTTRALTQSEVLRLAGAPIRDVVRDRIGGRDIGVVVRSPSGAWEDVASNRIRCDVGTAQLGLASPNVVYATSIIGHSTQWETHGETAIELSDDVVDKGAMRVNLGFPGTYSGNKAMANRSGHDWRVGYLGIDLGWSESEVVEHALRRSALRLWHSLSDASPSRARRVEKMTADDAADGAWHRIAVRARPRRVRSAAAADAAGDAHEPAMASFTCVVGDATSPSASAPSGETAFAHVSIEARDSPTRASARLLFYSAADGRGRRAQSPPITGWHLSITSGDDGDEGCVVDVSLLVRHSAELRPRLYRDGVGAIDVACAELAAGVSDSSAWFAHEQLVPPHSSRCGVVQRMYTLSARE